MINLILFPSTSCAYRDLLTHGDVEKHMVDGEGLGDYGGEDGEEIPLQEWKGRHTSNEDCDVGGTLICERLYVSRTMSFRGI
jgi:hypothetical protein